MANVLYECDWMIVCMLENMINKQKEWHTATKPLKKKILMYKKPMKITVPVCISIK